MRFSTLLHSAHHYLTYLPIPDLLCSQASKLSEGLATGECTKREAGVLSGEAKHMSKQWLKI